MRKVKYAALKVLEGIFINILEFINLESVLRTIFCGETCPCGCSGTWPIDGISDEEYGRIFNGDES